MKILLFFFNRCVCLMDGFCCSVERILFVLFWFLNISVVEIVCVMIVVWVFRFLS